MGRASRAQLPGSTVHLTARGIRHLPIYVDDLDRRMFIAFLAHSVQRRHWVCLAYCLMSNHYHVILELTKPNLSEGMHRLNWLYALRFNERHGHSGHLFEARFASTEIETEEHLLAALSYVVLNPVQAGICDDPGEWPWSSFRATAGLERCPPYLAVARVRRLFGSRRDGAARYAAHVRALAEQPLAR